MKRSREKSNYSNKRPATIESKAKDLNLTDYISGSVKLNPNDKSPGLVLSRDFLICYSGKNSVTGFRTVRASHGVLYNTSIMNSKPRIPVPYLWECEILKGLDSESSHVRIGWSTNKGALQCSVGYDKFSFGYRDVDGSRVHDGNRFSNYGDPYAAGDIIACLLSLDDNNPENNMIKYYKNGKDQGIAFSGHDFASGIYFPAVSLYGMAAVRVNFGPSFILRYDIPGAIPISELHPLNPRDRKIHDALIASIRSSKSDELASLHDTNRRRLARIPDQLNLISISLETALQQHKEANQQAEK